MSTSERDGVRCGGLQTKGGLSSRRTGEKRPKVDARWGGGAVTLMCKRMPFEVENLGIT